MAGSGKFSTHMQGMSPGRSSKVVANGSAGGLEHARTASSVLDGDAASALDGSAPEPNDYSNYFCTYSFIYHQKDMLEDHKRTGAYYAAVMQNRAQFVGKTVLDVGTGSGVLALFAAKAGARKVYAVEATDMAKHARRLVHANKFGDVIEVIQGMVESISLPEKVDIIISEWMGYFLLRESMLDSVILARDRFLKPGGALYPSHARMFLGAIRTQATQQRASELQVRPQLIPTERRLSRIQNAMDGWEAFAGDMQQYYGLDLDCLRDDYYREQADYYMATAAWCDVHPSQLAGPGACFKEYDLLTVTLDELKAPLQASCQLRILDGGLVDAFCGWFDTRFKGSPENPADFEVLLSTAPDATGATHWGQQVFFLNPPIAVAPGDWISCDVDFQRKKENHRLMKVVFTHKAHGTSMYAANAAQRVSNFSIE